MVEYSLEVEDYGVEGLLETSDGFDNGSAPEPYVQGDEGEHSDYGNSTRFEPPMYSTDEYV